MVVRGKGAGAGGYHLSVDGAVPPAPVVTAALDPALAAAAEGLSPEARAALEASAPVAEAPPEPPVDPKVALMRKQLAAYKVEQAAEAARRAEEARQAEIRRQEEEEERERRQEQARIARQEEEANRQQMFNTFIQGVQMVTQSYVEAKTERREQQARLNELAAARDRANAEKAAAAQRAQQEQVNAQRAAQNAQLARQLAEANATRDRMIAQSNDPAEKARLRAVNQQVVEIARRRGLDGELRQQQQALGGGQSAQSSAAGGQDAAADARRAQEEQAKAKEAERARLEAAALKRQDDMRRQQEAAAKQQEEARKAQELAAKRQAEAQANARKQAWLADRASGGFSTVGLGAVDKGATPPGQGEMTHQIGHIGQCAATSITVRYRLGALMGEPVVAGSWSFQGEDGCSPPHNTVVWLKLSNGAAYGWVRLDPGVPTANRGFGYNSPGSPNWGQLVCGFNGSGPAGCMSDAQARAMWANGQVVNFEVGW